MWHIHWCKYSRGSVCARDFISKFEIALKECNESEYWLELLFEVDNISKDEFEKLQKECIELRRMLVSSVTKLKQKLQ